MPAMLLQPTTYTPGSGGSGNRRQKDEHQTTRDYFSHGTREGLLSPPVRGMLSPTYSEDFPTPKASQYTREATVDNDFDDLYDMTDDETVDVPLFASNSIKRTKSIRSKRCSSVVIPSPSAWPTIEKLQKEGRLPNFPMSPPIVSPSPRSFSKMRSSNEHLPSSDSEPSLDGSLTSEDLSGMSCPSTPDLHKTQEDQTAVEEWGVQLDPQAMRTLRGLSTDESDSSDSDITPQAREEMREGDARKLKCDVNIVLSPVEADAEDPISAISVPSPGGFFSSLNANARHTWTLPAPDLGPTTGTATAFYGVPWRSPPISPKIEEQVVMIHDNTTDGPPTARALNSATTARMCPLPPTPASAVPLSANSLQSTQPSEESFKVVDYDDSYLEGLKKGAEANFDRTSLWLNAQESYISSLVDSTPASATENVVSPKTPKTPSLHTLDETSIKSPAKSVRWADESPTATIDKSLPPSPRDSTFVEGFKHYRSTNKRSDAFTQRKARIEALKLDRTCLAKAHRDQLAGKYELESPERPKQSRPVSDFYATEDPTEKTQMIDRVQKERQALEQIKPISWNLEATKMLNGGTLLTSPAGKTLFSADDAHVLDLGGHASCDWAWEVALQQPKATVHTVYTADQASKSKLDGPKNHKHTVVPNLWTLPFPSNHFDIVSARSLFALLKTNKAAGLDLDEYDLCLKECFRCLKPGGYLEFALLDADVLRAGPRTQALSVEFGFNLKTRGYDPAPTKSFLPRLKRAGFGQMRRAWLALPMARKDDGSTGDASCISGMIGAWAWERWMLKLQVEMGKGEEKLLEGVADAIDEGSESGAAWRYLSGWARKE